MIVSSACLSRIGSIIYCVGMLLCTASTARSAEVGFVTANGDLTKEFDIFWVDRLESQGHNVAVLPQTYRNSEAQDLELFIVSNDVGSGDFAAGGGETRRLLNLNPVELSGHADVQLSVALAARPTGWDEGIDFLSLSLDTNGNGVYDTQIADFQPIGGDLEDTISGQILNEFFEDLEVSISANVDTLRLQIEAYSTATGEQLGIDNIRITGAGGVVIGTETFEGGAGQIGYTTEGQGGADATFWDLSDADGVFPEIEFFDFEGDVWFGGADMDAAFGVTGAPHIVDPRPIITYENALFDELGIGASGGRFDGDTLEIVQPEHPLAAGLSGDVEIYDILQGITEIGDPLAEGTEVIATHLDAPVIAVLEPGAEGLDGSPSPRRVISIFSQDIGFGDDYTESGLALLDASVAYALSGAGEEGDYNGDGILDAADIDLQAAEMKKPAAEQDLARFDHNNDGVIDVGQAGPNQSNWGDRLIWIRTLKGTAVGDVNFDNVFDSGDLVLALTGAKYGSGEMATWVQGDWNGDMVFDSGDLVFAFQDGQYVAGATPAVPEPAGLCLLWLGAVILAMKRNPADRRLIAP